MSSPILCERTLRALTSGFSRQLRSMSEAATWPIQGLIRHFRPELERRIEEHNAKFAEAAE